MQQSEEARTLIRQKSPQIPEPILTYDQSTNRWSGANEHFSVWMDNATFHAYVTVWYEWRQWLPERLPAERYTAAQAHCQRLQYWLGCENNYDNRVHIRYF